MKTVGELRAWLQKIDSDDLPVHLMIETEECQYQYEMNDAALVIRNGIEQRFVVLMHETWDRMKK